MEGGRGLTAPQPGVEKTLISQLLTITGVQCIPLMGTALGLAIYSSSNNKVLCTESLRYACDLYVITWMVGGWQGGGGEVEGVGQ